VLDDAQLPKAAPTSEDSPIVFALHLKSHCPAAGKIVFREFCRGDKVLGFLVRLKRRDSFGSPRWHKKASAKAKIIAGRQTPPSE
jgi:hypothetical protein